MAHTAEGECGLVDMDTDTDTDTHGKLHSPNVKAAATVAEHCGGDSDGARERKPNALPFRCAHVIQRVRVTCNPKSSP